MSLQGLVFPGAKCEFKHELKESKRSKVDDTKSVAIAPISL